VNLLVRAVCDGDKADTFHRRMFFKRRRIVFFVIFAAP